MTDKLSWTEIEQQFNQQWVELVDYDWPDGEINPRSGIVRTHSQNRREFYDLMKAKDPNPLDSALVFVGNPKRDPNVIHVSPFKYAKWKS